MAHVKPKASKTLDIPMPSGLGRKRNWVVSLTAHEKTVEVDLYWGEDAEEATHSVTIDRKFFEQLLANK